MHKRPSEFHNKFTSFKRVSPKTKDNEDVKTKVLGSAGDIFNELYYNYKENYEEEKGALKKKTQRNLTTQN